jgi:(p)ppGpp synthase/HD superfamily hydrolase
MNKFQKREISLRYWLQGKGFHRALKCMEFAKAVHCGVRKDGFTPEFDHQISIAHYVRTLLPSLIYPEETICAVFGHDLGEPPYNYPRSEYEPVFGELASEAIVCMTKKYRDVVLEESVVFDRIARNPIASIAKYADRVHNLQTMPTVFTHTKQRSYVGDVKRAFLPAIKVSRRLFPEQEAAYENVKHVLVGQCEMIELILDASESKAA